MFLFLMRKSRRRGKKNIKPSMKRENVWLLFVHNLNSFSEMENNSRGSFTLKTNKIISNIFFRRQHVSFCYISYRSATVKNWRHSNLQRNVYLLHVKIYKRKFRIPKRLPLTVKLKLIVLQRGFERNSFTTQSCKCFTMFILVYHKARLWDRCCSGMLGRY